LWRFAESDNRLMGKSWGLRETPGIFRLLVLRGVGRRDDGKVTWKFG
jgi:hypothetical protein